MFAFFLESAFLGLFLYGEKRLSPRAHWWSAVAVFLGSWLSGFFIVATDAWMQHPVGYIKAADGSVQRSILDMLSRPATAKVLDPSQMLAVVSIMNWGVAPEMRTPEGLRLTDLRSASRMREAIALGGYVMSGFDGRIGIDLAWPEGDPTVPGRIECLREQFGRLTRLP